MWQTYVSYRCGATTDDLILPDILKSVGLHGHKCSDPIKKIYYSAYKDDFIRIHCDTFFCFCKQSYLTCQSNTHPYCAECSSLERMTSANDCWSQLAVVLLYLKLKP